MIHSTTPSIQGKVVKEYHGVVTGEAILGVNIFKNIFAGIRDTVGGRSAAYEEELQKARKLAFVEMSQQAPELGVNAMVGIDIDYETVGAHGGMLTEKDCMQVTLNAGYYDQWGGPVSEFMHTGV